MNMSAYTFLQIHPFDTQPQPVTRVQAQAGWSLV